MEQTITKLENKWILHPKTDEELKEIATNGETHEVDQLVIGTDEIRDWKLKNGLNI